MKTSRKYSSPPRGFDFSCVYFSMFLYNFCYLLAVISKYLHEAPFCYGLAGLRELLTAFWVLLARSWSPQERPRSAQNRAKSRPRPLQDRFQTSPRPPQDQPKTLMDSLRPFGLPVEPFWLPFGFHLAAFLINLIAFWLPSCLLRPGFGL